MSDWLTYSPSSGHGNGQIRITASTLSELQDRFETIIAYNNFYSISATSIVYQKSVPPTSITFDSLTVEWVKDVPYTGGIADKDNCEFRVYATYSDGSVADITDVVTVTGSLVVSATTAATREMVGTLTLTAEFEGVTATTQVSVYQEPEPQYARDYFTIEVISGGIIKYEKDDRYTAGFRTYHFRKNNGNWDWIPSSGISVQQGDVVQLKIEFWGGSQVVSGYFTGSTATFNISGNIMSLIFGDDFINRKTLVRDDGHYSGFDHMFAGVSVISAENLIMPATTLVNACYGEMFMNCGNLIKAPKILPATTLSDSCYMEMFYGCTAMTTSPELPAPVLVNECYFAMFMGCNSLQSIKCLATTNLGLGYTSNWVASFQLLPFSPSGTFIKAASASGWSSGNNGIPNGWTVVNNT